jgi:Protein of unknown function (DUF2511)
MKASCRWLVCLAVSACAGGATPVEDPIPEMPASHQRRISRLDFPDAWPFAPGIGTLGCAGDAVVFRVQGVTYALNDQAQARGYANADSIVVPQSTQPSRPLRRVTQDERMRIFGAADHCTSSPEAAACRQRLALAHGLSREELAQVEAEGRERSWPPLSPPRKSTAPVVRAGAAMCR